MKILIDNSNLYAGGGIQVATSFLYDLLSRSDEFIYFVVQSANSAKQVNRANFDERFVFFDLDAASQSICGRRKALMRLESELKPNVIFTIFGPSYHRSTCPKVVGFAIGHILYPKSAFYNRLTLVELIKFRFSNFLKDFFFKKNSDALIFETDDANKIYSFSLRRKISTYTVSNTIGEIFNNKSEWCHFSVNKTDCDILYLTANYAHKNLEIIPLVIEELLKANVNFNFCFHLSVSKEELGFPDKYDQYINYLGKVDLRYVPSLYEKMDIMFMPSMLEIFSASYLEAMFMGIPIIASDESFSRGICRDAALYNSTMDAKGYAEKIQVIFNNPTLRNKLIEKGKSYVSAYGNSLDRTASYLQILNKHAKFDEHN